MDGAAMLVVRVWFEDEAAAGFRARVTIRPDLTKPAETVLSSSEPDEVLRLMREWLAAVTQR